MRIAVAYDCFFPLTTGGGERQYRSFAEAYAAAGHEVAYLTRRQWTGRAPEVDGIEVVAVSGPGTLYDGHGNRRPTAALRFAWGLFRHLVVRRRRYDVLVVSALPVLNVFAARLALAGGPTRVCADFLEVWRRPQWLEYSGPVVGRVAALLQRLAVRVSPYVSCHSQMNGRRLAAEGARRPPIVSPGLIAPEVRRGEDMRVASAGGPVVLYVGRHIPDKRVETVPAAVAWARQHVPGLRAVLLGDGATRPAVLAEIERLGLEGVVEAPGFVAEETLREHLSHAAVLVNPSRREGYGLVVVEACAVGTPVVLVAAEDNASTELVQDGVNGVVASSTSPETLGAALLRVVEGGAALRRSAQAWFDEAARTRTVTAAALQILEVLTGAPR